MTTEYDDRLNSFWEISKPRERPFLASLTERYERPGAWDRVEIKIPLHKADPADHEVGISMTDAAILSTLWLENIVTCGPEHLELIGTNASGERVHVMRHYTQPAIALTAVKKQDAEQEPRRIGFLFSEQK